MPSPQAHARTLSLVRPVCRMQWRRHGMIALRTANPPRRNHSLRPNRLIHIACNPSVSVHSPFPFCREMPKRNIPLLIATIRNHLEYSHANPHLVRVEISTPHQVKGREADTVQLDKSMVDEVMGCLCVPHFQTAPPQRFLPAPRTPPPATSHECLLAER